MNSDDHIGAVNWAVPSNDPPCETCPDSVRIPKATNISKDQSKPTTLSAHVTEEEAPDGTKKRVLHLRP